MPASIDGDARLARTTTVAPSGGPAEPRGPAAGTTVTATAPGPRIVLVNRFFHPDHSATAQMATDLAVDLAAAGWQVDVIASRQRYDDPAADLAAHEVVAGVSIHRVATTRYGRHRLVFRALDYLSFYTTAMWAAWRLLRRGSVLIAKTDPPLLSVALGPIARLRGARLVNWLQDVFPEVAERLGVTGGILKPLIGPLRALRNRSLRRAAANVVLGRRMEAEVVRLARRPETTIVIPNWQDGAVVRPVPPDQNAFRSACGFSNHFVVGYSGNLGRAHDVATMIGAMENVSRQPAGTQISWLFVGGGRLYDDLVAEVDRRGLKNVRFAPYQPRERLAESLSVSDVHLVTLRPDLEGLIVPSKFYGVAAAGRATIFIGAADGEIAQDIARIGCGVTVPCGDGAALAAAVLRMAGDHVATAAMGRAARAAFERDFDRVVALGRWRELLRSVAGGATPAAAMERQTTQV